jgi:Zn-dependent protease
MDLVAFTALAATLPYQQVRTAVVLFVGLVLSLALHEFGHAAAAVWLGDDTPRRSARVSGSHVDPIGLALGVNRGMDNRFTVNPLSHADPIGTVLLPLTALFLLPGGFLFGWGRPVPFNPLAARRRVSFQSMIYTVSLAGPAMNLVQAFAWLAILAGLVAVGAASSANEVIRDTVLWAQLLVGLNFILFAFNLLPVPPLDGGHILVESIRRTHPDWARWLEQYGLFVFLFLMPILPWLLRPVVVGSGHLTALVIRLAGG